MGSQKPLEASKGQYKEIIDRISVANSPVGIDAQYTHAVIISYLQQIAERLERLERDFTRFSSRYGEGRAPQG